MAKAKADDPKPASDRKRADRAREEKLAKALRENLRRRKTADGRRGAEDGPEDSS
jgi:hypothetical protein